MPAALCAVPPRPPLCGCRRLRARAHQQQQGERQRPDRPALAVAGRAAAQCPAPQRARLAAGHPRPRRIAPHLAAPAHGAARRLDGRLQRDRLLLLPPRPPPPPTHHPAARVSRWRDCRPRTHSCLLIADGGGGGGGGGCDLAGLLGCARHPRCSRPQPRPQQPRHAPPPRTYLCLAGRCRRRPTCRRRRRRGIGVLPRRAGCAAPRPSLRRAPRGATGWTEATLLVQGGGGGGGGGHGGGDGGSPEAAAVVGQRRGPGAVGPAWGERQPVGGGRPLRARAVRGGHYPRPLRLNIS
jgi:hypothetical protein